MFDRGAVRQWYQYALDFKASSSASKLAVSSSMRCSLLRLAALRPEIGRKLDEMRATFTVCRYVAFGDDIATQIARAVDALAQLAERENRAGDDGVASRGEGADPQAASISSAFAKLAAQPPRPAPPTPQQRPLPDAQGQRNQSGPSRDLRLLTLLLTRPRSPGAPAR
jgi:hypothetical protein